MNIDFTSILRDSIGHVLFSRYYFFHRSFVESDYIYPLFAYERYVLGNNIDSSAKQLLYRAADILARFRKDIYRQYLAAVFDLKLSDSLSSTEKILEAFVGDETFDLLSRDRWLSFAGYGRIPIDSTYGVRTEPRVRVLVLGSYYPFPQDYFEALFADPVCPEQKLAMASALTNIETVLLVSNYLEMRGCDVVTGLSNDGRDIRNVFQRLQYTMAVADKIVLLFARGSMGLAIEYGVICADPELARKTVVLVKKEEAHGPGVSAVAGLGTFLLQNPTTIIYDHESEILAMLDELYMLR